MSLVKISGQLDSNHFDQFRGRSPPFGLAEYRIITSSSGAPPCAASGRLARPLDAATALHGAAALRGRLTWIRGERHRDRDRTAVVIGGPGVFFLDPVLLRGELMSLKTG